MHVLRLGARVTAASLSHARPLERLSAAISVQTKPRWLSLTSRPAWSAALPSQLWCRQFSSTLDSEEAKADSNVGAQFSAGAALDALSELPEALRRVLSLENACQREKNKFEKRQVALSLSPSRIIRHPGFLDI